MANYCEKCKGVCWKGDNNKKTQEAALKMFGIIPNKCVVPELGSPLCPYSKKTQ